MKSNKDYSEVLDLSEDFTEQEVLSHYTSKNNELLQQYTNAEISYKDYQSLCKQLERAKSKALRYAYKEATKAAKTDDGYESVQKSSVGKKVAVATTAVVTAGAIAVSSFFMGRGFEKKHPSVLNTNETYTQETVSPNEVNTTVATEPATEPTTEPTATENKEEGKRAIVSFGDITNKDEVTKRATALADQLGGAGVINMSTNEPFTVDELIDITEYINGAFIPASDGEASARWNDFINFCLMDSELTIQFANVNGIVWGDIEDEDWENTLENNDLKNLKELQKTTPKINVVDNMLYGDASVAAYNYLKMFESKYQEMLYSYDQNKIDDIYWDLTYSLTRLRVNGEYTFNWNNEEYTVTMNDFSGVDKINTGNILQYYVFMYQTIHSKYEKAIRQSDGTTSLECVDDPSSDKYTYFYEPGEIHGDTVEDSEERIGYHDENVTIDYDANFTEHKYLETTEFYNAAANEETILKEISLDDEGYLFLIGEQSEENFSLVNLVNTVNNAIRNYVEKDLDYYHNTFNRTLRKTK